MADKVVIQFTGDATGLKKAIDEIDRELGQLVVQTDRAKASLGPGLGKAAQNFTQSTKNMTKATRLMRSQMQNVGYQLQDTVVQLEMGTHWTRVLGQQGTQVAGMFGAWPAILSAAGAAILAVGANMDWFGEEVLSVDDAVKALNESLSEYEKIKERQAGGVGSGAFEQTLGELTRLREIMNQGDLVENFDQVITSMIALAEEAGKVSWLEIARGINSGLMAGAEVGDRMSQSRKELELMERVLRDIQGTASDKIIKVYAEAVLEAEKLYGTESNIYKQLLNQVPIVEQYALARDSARQMAEDELAQMAGLEPIVISLTAAAHDRLSAEVQLRQVLADEDLIMGMQVAKSAEMVALTAQRAAIIEGMAMQSLRNRFGSDEDLAMGQSFSVDTRNLYRGRKTKSAGGGGSSKEDKDLLEELRKEYELKMQLREVDEARRIVMEKLGDDASKYTEAQIEGVERTIEAHKRWEEQMEMNKEAWDIVGSGIEDAFMDMITGAESFEDAMKAMAKSVIQELFRILVLQKLIGTAAGGGVAGTGLLGLLTNAKGNAFDGGSVVPFAKGGIVNSPTLFPMSQGAGLMGEAGPEAIVPLKRDGTGSLGVGASPVVIHNYTGAEVAVEDRGDERHVIIGQAVSAVRDDFSRSMSSGQGVWARGIESGYNARRRTT